MKKKVCANDASHVETAVIEKTAHTEVTIPAVAATCTEAGKTAGAKCSVCGEIITAQTVVPAKGHTGVIDPYVAATCTSTGLTEGRHCSVCGKVFVAQEIIPMKNHSDSDMDGKCDSCGCNCEVSCGCICHKNFGLMKFFYRIQLFFWKLFKIGKSCDCGTLHY